MMGNAQDLEFYSRRKLRKNQTVGTGFKEAMILTRMYHNSNGKEWYRNRVLSDTGFDFPGMTPYLPYDVEADYGKWREQHPEAPSLQEIDETYTAAVEEIQNDLAASAALPDFDGDYYLGEEPEEYGDPGFQPGMIAGSIAGALQDPVNLALAPAGMYAPGVALKLAAAGVRAKKSLSGAAKIQNMINSPVKKVAMNIGIGAATEAGIGAVAEHVISTMSEDQRRMVLGETTELTPEEIDEKISDENFRNVIYGFVGGAIFGGALSAIPGVALSQRQYDEILEMVAPAGTKYRKWTEDVRAAKFDREPELKQTMKTSRLDEVDIDNATEAEIVDAMGIPRTQAEYSAVDGIDLAQTMRRKLYERMGIDHDPVLDKAFDDVIRATARSDRGGLELEDVLASAKPIQDHIDKMFPDNGINVGRMFRPVETGEDVFVQTGRPAVADVARVSAQQFLGRQVDMRAQMRQMMDRPAPEDVPLTETAVTPEQVANTVAEAKAVESSTPTVAAATETGLRSIDELEEIEAALTACLR